MKIIFAVILCVFAAVSLSAQTGEITYILFRHAEKDPSPQANKADVDLSDAGRQRAARLVEVVRPYNPEQLFATIFRRTRLTVTPLAEAARPGYRLMIQNYDYAGIEEFAEQLLKLNARTVVVSGHNTTTPQLANLLIKQEKYKPLDESEYDKMWIIKIKRGRDGNKVVEEKMITY